MQLETRETVSPRAIERRKRRAAKAGLVYVNDYQGWLRRRRCGRGFTYVDDLGRTIRESRTRSRIKTLAIPPAWKDTLICPSERGHIQAVGTDDAGRRQAIYHPDWKRISSRTKFDRMRRFGQCLPRLRRRVRKDLSGRRLSPDRVYAAVVRIIDKTHLRVGNDEYTQKNNSRGATTLSQDNLSLDGTAIELDFVAKSGKRRRVHFSDRKVAKVLEQCVEIDGQFLFKYVDTSEQMHCVTSTEINGYILDVTNEHLTAKDFRTWAGSVLALEQFAALDFGVSQRRLARQITASVDRVAGQLGNTRSVCRESYIHPALLEATESAELPELLADLPRESHGELTIAETQFRLLLPKLQTA